jgi:hypothetical protein
MIPPITVTVPRHAYQAAREFLTAQAELRVAGEALLALESSNPSNAEINAVCEAHEKADKAMHSAAHMFALACAPEIAAGGAA